MVRKKSVISKLMLHTKIGSFQSKMMTHTTMSEHTVGYPRKYVFGANICYIRKCVMSEHRLHTNTRCILSKLMLHTDIYYVRTYVHTKICSHENIMSCVRNNDIYENVYCLNIRSARTWDLFYMNKCYLRRKCVISKRMLHTNMRYVRTYITHTMSCVCTNTVILL